MTMSWYYEVVGRLLHNVAVLLISLIVSTLISCKYRTRKQKDPKFIDENDPHAKTLYNIKTDVAFPKTALKEKLQNPRKDITAMSWSCEYENNMPPSLSLSSSPTPLNSKKHSKSKSHGNKQQPGLRDSQNLLSQKATYIAK